jgi:5'(3')-deoxyribonucleotidase
MTEHDGGRDFVLGVDLDGVCADHATAFRQVVALERGVDPDDLPPQQTWNFHEWGLTDETFEQIHRRAILDHRMFRSMPPIAGAAETLWRLSDAGCWIRVITHRLYANWGHAVAVADTVAWLDEVGIPYRDICFLGNKPEVEADAYIDDAPHNVVELRRAGNPVIVFDQPYNRHLDGLRATGWDEVERLVTVLRLERGEPVQTSLGLPPDGPDRLARRVRSGPGAPTSPSTPADDRR